MPGALTFAEALADALKKHFGFSDDDLRYRAVHFDPEVKRYIDSFTAGYRQCEADEWRKAKKES